MSWITNVAFERAPLGEQKVPRLFISSAFSIQRAGQV